MQDVADQANVSRMTVSRALRHDSKIAVATRERIERIAREIGYRPNPLVAALMSDLRQQKPMKEISTLAFLTAYPTRFGWREAAGFRRYFTGAQKRAEQLGYKVQDFWLREEGFDEKVMARILRARGIAGIMIAPTPEACTPIRLPWESFSVVAFGYSMDIPPVHRITNHLSHSLLLALRKLGERGYRRIGVCMPSDANERVDDAWLSSHLLFCHRLPLAQRVRPLFTKQWNQDVFLQWLRRESPDAIVTGSYRTDGKLVSDWIAEAGLRTPDDIGFALLAWSPEVGPIAGIDQDFEAVGAAAVDLLVEQLHQNERGIPKRQKVVLIEGSWRDGDTIRQQTTTASSG